MGSTSEASGKTGEQRRGEDPLSEARISCSPDHPIDSDFTHKVSPKHGHTYFTSGGSPDGKDHSARRLSLRPRDTQGGRYRHEPRATGLAARRREMERAGGRQ